MASNVRAMMQLSTGEWVDISEDLWTKDPVTIKRGRADQAQAADPGWCRFTLGNSGGRYAPENPRSPYYQLIGPNTPVRIYMRGWQPYLRIPDDQDARAAVPGDPDLDLTSGDLDVRLELALDRLPAQWGDAPALAGQVPHSHAVQEVINRWGGSPRRGWRVLVSQAGALAVSWSTDGSNYHEMVSTACVPYSSGQRWALRVTLNTDDGAGGHVAHFYTAPALAGPWHQLGDPVQGSGATTIHQDATPGALEVGSMTGSAYPVGAGRYYAAELRNGIDGTVLAAPDFTTAEPGDTSLVDPQGNTWTLAGGTEITDWYQRFHGYVEEWPQEWGATAHDARVPVRAWGLLHLLRGTRPLQSTLYRKLSTHPDVLGYWSAEDGSTATSIAPGRVGGRVMSVQGLDMASESGLPSSAPLPRVGQTGGRVRVSLPSLPTPSLGWRVEMVYYLDQLPDAGQQWFRLVTSGGTITQVVGYIGGGEARIRLYNADGDIINQAAYTNADALTAATSGWGRVRLVALVDGFGWDYRCWWTPIGADEAWWVGTASAGFTRPVAIETVWGTGLANMPVGHFVYVNDPDQDVYGAGTGGPDDAYAGERTISRMRRLAQEERIPFSVPGLSGVSPQMGSQRIQAKMSVVEEGVALDGGTLMERPEIGLAYVPRELSYNRPVSVTIPYGACKEMRPKGTTDFTNDLTVQRINGSSAQAALEEGPRSVQDPPAGAGLKERSTSVNAYRDDVLPGLAAHGLYMSTWDGDRYPVVEVPLHRASETLQQQVLDRLGVQARALITDMPDHLPPGDVDIVVEGYEEVILPRTWRWRINASPAGPWTVGEIGHADPDDDRAPCHIDTDGSELDADADATTTGLIVQTTVGHPWVTSSGPAPTAATGDLPFDVRVGGEVVTVEAIEPLIWDDFGRTETNGWGTTPSAVTPTPSWAISGGTASERSVSGGQGVVTVGDTTTPRFQYLPAWSIPDCELLVAVTPAAVATGAALRAALLMRVSGANYYLMRANFAATGAVGLEVVHTTSSLTGVAATGVTYGAGTRLWLRCRVEGQRVRGRAWRDGSPEPGRWYVDHTVTSSTIATGPVGVTAARATSNTNANASFAFDDFQVITPQFMQVTRSVNGITKAHAAGTDVRLAAPLIISL